MVPSARNLGVGALIAGLAALCVLLPLASASPTTLFVATPSYSHFGASRDVGSSVASSTGTGYNAVLKGPSFSPRTGIEKESQLSRANLSGLYSLEVWSGLTNLTFHCGANCTTGNHTVTLNWTLSWSIHTASDCPTYGGSGRFLTKVGVNIVAKVLTGSAASPTTVGATLYVVEYHHQANGIPYRTGATRGVYAVMLTADLTSGHSYVIQSWVEIETAAFAWTGGCHSAATASSGVTGPSELNQVSVS